MTSSRAARVKERLRGFRRRGAPERFSLPIRRCFTALLASLLAVAACDDPPAPAGGERTTGPGAPGASTATPADLETSGRWSEAAALYRDQALASNELEESAAAIRKALSAYFMADRPDDARRFADEVLGRWPEFHDVLLFLADHQRVTMRLDEARETARRFVERAPGDPRGALVQGLVDIALGDTESGLESLDRFLRDGAANPEHRAEAEVVRVRALRRLGRRAEAADDITALLERRPLDPVVLAEAAQTFAFARKPDLARIASRQHRWLARRGHRLALDDPVTLERAPPGKDARTRLALQARDRRELLDAARALGSLLAEHPGDPELSYLLARLWLRASRYRECHLVIDAARAGDSAVARDLLHIDARVLRAQGRVKEASDRWRRAIESIGPGAGALEDPADVLLAAAEHALRDAGDVDLAGRYAERAVELEPGDRRAVASLAWIAIVRGERDRARALVERLETIAGGEHGDVVRLDATLRGLAGDLRAAARGLTPLIVKQPQDERNFDAFLLVFGDQGDVPEVAQVRELQAQWRERRQRFDEQSRRVAETPLERASGEYHRLALLALEGRDRNGALDALAMAADLDPDAVDSLKTMATVLDRPEEIFLRLGAMRRALDRSPTDTDTIERLARTYVELDVRLDEATRLANDLREPARGEILEAIAERKGS